MSQSRHVRLDVWFGADVEGDKHIWVVFAMWARYARMFISLSNCTPRCWTIEIRFCSCRQLCSARTTTGLHCIVTDGEGPKTWPQFWLGSAQSAAVSAPVASTDHFLLLTSSSSHMCILYRFWLLRYSTTNNGFLHYRWFCSTLQLWLLIYWEFYT